MPEAEISGKNSRMKTITIRDLTLGDGIPKICVPVAAETEEELDRTLRRLSETKDFYDMAELRADICPVKNLREVPGLLNRVHEAAGDKPVLYTFRTPREGGSRPISAQEYRERILCAAENGADLVDLELAMVEEEKDAGEDLLKKIRAKGAIAVGSFHDFTGTPPAEELIRKMVRMQDIGFDITKTAVMPRDREDVLELLFASVQMSESWADRPYITMSMGNLGKISRVFGEFTGSCITFGTVGASSAPGQIAAENLRYMLRTLN